MKKPVVFFSLFAFLVIIPVGAQENAGFSFSSWGGILALAQNPANVFSPEMKADIHLFSVALAADNNYLSLNPSRLIAGADIKEILEAKPDGELASAWINLEVVGPSFLIRLSGKDALAFSTKDRVLANIDDIPVEAANILYDTLLGTGANNYSFSGDYASINVHNWLEYALSYGRLLFRHGPHRLKAGITCKLLQGVGSYAVTVRNFQSQMEITDHVIEFAEKITAEVAYGHSQNMTWGNSENGLLKKEAMGVGFDMGGVYEYDPDHSSAEETINGNSPQRGNYKFKVGFAILDLGAITYKKKLGSRNFTADVEVLDTDVFDPVENQADLNAAIYNIDGVTPQAEDSGKFVMDLPARINAYVDYRICKGIYLNLNPVIALNNGKSDSYRNHQRTMGYFSLRIEKPWVGIYIPGAIGGLSGFRLGLGIKVGPLLVGSSSILGLLLRGQTKAADVFIGMRIPIL